MSGDEGEGDTARRLIAKLLQFTLPGQIELPLNWVNGPEKVEEDTVSDDDCIEQCTNVVIALSQDESIKDENLEDGELLDDDEEEDGEIIEKENIASSYFHFGRCIVPKCRFSHLPLDDYTRPVFEKALKDEEEAAISANAIPLSSAFSSSQNIPVNCPPNFPPPSFSKSANPVMHTYSNSLLYNKNAVRKCVAPYNKKPPKTKSISSVPHSNVTVDSLLSDITFSLPNLRQCC
uniref:C3H1-type domain-containing protein n=1 Tax=Panagrolaimus sp. ES5 TaxID=591445 RepID=A0AC34GNL5_9BILA